MIVIRKTSFEVLPLLIDLKCLFFSRILGYFLVGTLFCTLTTELAKYKIGRLRPYFLTVCKPDMSDAICKVEGTIEEFWSFKPTLFVVPAFKAEIYIQ